MSKLNCLRVFIFYIMCYNNIYIYSVFLRAGHWWCWSWVMELKVWVDGVIRVVCGLSLNTSCQDVVIALAQAIGKSPSCYSTNFTDSISPSVPCISFNTTPQVELSLKKTCFFHNWIATSSVRLSRCSQFCIAGCILRLLLIIIAIIDCSFTICCV